MKAFRDFYVLCAIALISPVTIMFGVRAQKKEIALLRAACTTTTTTYRRAPITGRRTLTDSQQTHYLRAQR